MWSTVIILDRHTHQHVFGFLKKCHIDMVVEPWIRFTSIFSVFINGDCIFLHKLFTTWQNQKFCLAVCYNKNKILLQLNIWLRQLEFYSHDCVNRNQIKYFLKFCHTLRLHFFSLGLLSFPTVVMMVTPYYSQTVAETWSCQLAKTIQCFVVTYAYV